MIPQLGHIFLVHIEIWVWGRGAYLVLRRLLSGSYSISIGISSFDISADSLITSFIVQMVNILRIFYARISLDANELVAVIDFLSSVQM